MSLKERFDGKWVVKPTKDLIKEMYGSVRWTSHEPGELDAQIHAAIYGDTLSATVRMNYSKHHVRIQQVGKNQIQSKCTCPQWVISSSVYNYDNPACEHIVATLQYFSEHFETLIHDSYTRKEHIDSLLEKVPQKDALQFLADTMENNGGVYAGFLKKFQLSRMPNKVSYDMNLDRMYYAAMDHKEKISENLSFEDYFDAAAESGGDLQSAKVYQSISEAINRNMSLIDDSDGYYADCFIESIENLAESVLRLPNRRKHIAYFVSMMTKARPEFSRHYRTALETVCSSQEDLAYLEKIIKLKLEKEPEDPKRVTDLMHLYVYVLDETGRTDESMQRLAAAYGLDTTLRTKYLDHLMQSDSSRDHVRDTALRIAEEFPDDETTADLALDMCDKSDPRYLDLAVKLFMSTGGWKYHAKMRESDAWDASKMVDALVKKDDTRKAVELCVREKMYEDAMQILESKKHMGLLGIYAEKLGKKYPDRYFDAYAPLIRKLASDKILKKRITKKMSFGAFRNTVKAASDSDLKHYEKIRTHLRNIKTVGNDRYGDLIRFVRLKNKKNALLLKSIENL